MRSEGASDADALLHAAGEFRRIHLGVVFHVDALQFFHGDVLRFGSGLAVAVDEAFGDIFQDVLISEKVELLEDHRGFPSEAFDFIFGNFGEIDRYVVNREFAGVWLFEIVQAAEEGSFPRAGRAEDRYYITFFNVQVDVFQVCMIAERFANMFCSQYAGHDEDLLS